MTIYLSEILKEYNFIFLILAFLLNIFLFIFFIKNKFINYLLSKVKYSGLQRAHDGEVLRIGGLVSFVSLFFYGLIMPTESGSKLLSILFCCIPMMLFSFLEDITYKTHHALRLISITISCLLLLFFFIENYPSSESFHFLSFIFENKISTFLFYLLCLLILSNGLNFIDGMNGMLFFNSFSIVLSFLFLCLIYEDYLFRNIFFSIAITLLIFGVFNYPLGKIFFGDSGAYLLGLLIGSLSIVFFANHSISIWNAVLILFYPVMEVFVSFFRKLYNKKSPFLPDRNHLHLKIYYYFLGKKYSKILSNNLVVIVLSVFWLVPPISIFYIYDNNFLIFVELIIIFLTYIIYMITFPNVD